MSIVHVGKHSLKLGAPWETLRKNYGPSFVKHATLGINVRLYKLLFQKLTGDWTEMHVIILRGNTKKTSIEITVKNAF